MEARLSGSAKAPPADDAALPGDVALPGKGVDAGCEGDGGGAVALEPKSSGLLPVVPELGGAKLPGKEPVPAPGGCAGVAGDAGVDGDCRVGVLLGPLDGGVPKSNGLLKLDGAEGKSRELGCKACGVGREKSGADGRSKEDPPDEDPLAGGVLPE